MYHTIITQCSQGIKWKNLNSGRLTKMFSQYLQHLNLSVVMKS
jgi:hypothetical protein